ncbi:Rpn family recombination-promoting nuclease/putative transposase [Bacillus sp. 2SH]|uniref:Rpn family recombination-promoting nuclease/putative transposase n=1 Tax=Bacillus sp. 2SH TaxID=2502202 RepID=UPI0010FA1F13|nr:Rpn family recombination-promoting nuclease/putative transposase [Bacillus sp. 2SH]
MCNERKTSYEVGRGKPMSNQQLVNLRIDFAFKQLFGTSGNEDILIAFLNAMLQDSLESPIVSLQLEDPHLHREHEEDKLSILDISATLDSGTKVNVEIQLNNNHDMIKRSLYYWGRLYTSQLQKGIQKWRNEQVNPWEDWFVRWLLLLPANEEEQLTQTLEDIAMSQDPILQKAMNKWERMSQDSSFRQAYEAREKALMDEAAKFAHARNEGIQEEKIQMIKGMHELGVSIETIAKASKLSVEEVKLILKGNS